ncbi:MAG: serine/threonine protein kinase [Phycisphaerales bacterium]|nr:serine/threonine protein kinase [Phycisphaerales bacterium]
MTSDREKDIFFGALDLGPDAREDYLARHCAGDGPMLARLRALLAAHEQAREFMGAPTIDEAPRPAPRAGAEPAIGATVGPYTLESVLGEGGFGRVYLARQREPVARTVALKVLKAGMDSAAIVARFEAERQALAVMDHPHVARVYDGGETDSGRPYFVMELVRGEPLTDYCATKSLSTRQRLDLFEQVCLAVQHAHHKGIIHRDLKPSNVLVTTIDGRPSPKVIDFGIAKAIGAQAAGATAMTVEGHMIGTPAYMSPEQVCGAAAMDTRSDVYTLGVLLYELLTGVPPFDPARLEKVPLGGLAKIICEESPPKPSTRVLKADGTTAVQRHLASRLRGDLDWIVMKALEKEPDRRYQTALALASDIRRYLRDQAVEAGPPSGLYRARKFALRHRGELLASGLILAALVAGLVSSLVFATRVERQAALTARELEKSRAFAGFATSMLAGIDPAVAQGADTTLIKKMLADAKARLALEPASSDEAEAEMHELLGIASYKIADFAEAEAQFSEALRHAGAVAPPDSELVLRLRHALGQTYAELTMPDRAREELAAVHGARNQTLGPDDPRTIAALFDLAHVDRLMGEYERARDTLGQVVLNRERVLGSDHRDTMSARNTLATVLDELGEHERAGELFRQIIAYQERELGPEHPHTLATKNNYTDTLEALGRTQEAVDLLRELLETKRRVLEPDHPSLLVALNNLASLERELGDTEQAGAHLGEAAAIAARTLGPRDMRTLILTNNHAKHLLQTGRAPEARALLAPALPLCEEVLGPDHKLTLAMLANTVGIDLALGEPASAAAAARTLLERVDDSAPADDAGRVGPRRLLGEALLEAGDAPGAEAVLLEAFAMLERGMVGDPEDVGKTASLLARACAALGREADAAAWRERAGER